MKRPNKYRWLLLMCVALSGCIKNFDTSCDEVPDENETIFTEGYSLDFVVTLDNLGGDDVSALKYDNYVDPEKFRILFFTDDQDENLPEDERNVFLFESRTRFIKQLPTKSATWRVSVPLFSYGNAVAAKWNWEKIRRFMRTHPFKIALLVNRPESEWSMRIVGKTEVVTSTDASGNKSYSWGDNQSDVIVPGAWYDNSAPKWEVENTYFGEADGSVVINGELDRSNKETRKANWKTLLDLHHVQYDPIYTGKGFVVAGKQGGAAAPDKPGSEEEKLDLNTGQTPSNRGFYDHDKNAIYDFIADVDTDGYLYMGSTASWVSWSGYDGELATNPNITGKTEPAASDTNKDPHNWNLRRVIHPTPDYPIPMYGIQRFDPIEEWDWGTSASLDRTIFLLRSVVRLDLYVPRDMTLSFLTLFYPNVFSRCEPMDVWTPTDELWNKYVVGAKALEDSGKDYPYDVKYEANYERTKIFEYGPIVRPQEVKDFEKGNTRTDESIARYHERISWLYGIWTDNLTGNWNWNNDLNDNIGLRFKGTLPTTVKDDVTGESYYPHIFNPCVQRNTAVYCPVGDTKDPAWNDYLGGGNTVEVYDSKYPSYKRYVIYTGERNINDPSVFTDIGDDGSGKAPVAYFMIGVNDPQGNTTSYSIPLVNYDKYNGDNPIVKSQDYGFGMKSDGKTRQVKPANTLGSTRTNAGATMTSSSFEKATILGKDESSLPYPLIRNHVYQFFITKTGNKDNPYSTRADGGTSEIRASSAVRRSEYVVRERPEARPEVAPDPAPEE